MNQGDNVTVSRAMEPFEGGGNGGVQLGMCPSWKWFVAQVLWRVLRFNLGTNDQHCGDLHNSTHMCIPIHTV